MNFLAHLYIAEARSAEPAGAVLGDAVRGPDLSAFASPVAESIRLHRRIDAAFDRHPGTLAARRNLPAAERRWAAISLDLYADYWLARRWGQWHDEPLARFARRCAERLARSETAFAAAGRSAPTPEAFTALLLSYREPEGVDRAIDRIARRARYPERLRAGCANWQRHGAWLDEALPAILRDCLMA